MSVHSYIVQSQLYFVVNLNRVFWGVPNEEWTFWWVVQSTIIINKLSNCLSYLSPCAFTALAMDCYQALHSPICPVPASSILSEVSFDKVCLITNCLVTLYALPDAHISLRNCCILFYLSMLERIYYLVHWDKRFRKWSRSLCTFKQNKSRMRR